MLLKVTSATYLKDYKIKLWFNGGLKGIVDLKNSIKGQVFKPLQNIDYFKTFTQKQMDNWMGLWCRFCPWIFTRISIK